MKWILFMTLLTNNGAATHTVEFNRETDCWEAAQVWVAANDSRRTSARAFCMVKR